MSCNQEEWCRSGVNGGVTIIRVTAASSTQRYNISGVSGEEETQENRKVGVKRKGWILAQLPYSPQGKGKQSPRVEPGG